MKKALITTFLLVLSLSASGCIIRPAADTVITIKKENNPDFGKRKLGLKRVFWAQSIDEIEVAGHGSHPREAQTYMFFWMEPSCVFERRDIHIKFSKEKSHACKQCQIELLLVPSLLQNLKENEPLKYGPQLLFTGSVKCKPKTFLGKLYIKLKDVKLTRQNGIDEDLIISGKIVAKKTDKVSFAEEKILCRLKGTRFVEIDQTEKPDLISEEITVYKNGRYQWDYYFPGRDDSGGELEGTLPRPIIEQLYNSTQEYRNNCLNFTTPFYCFKKDGNVLTLNYDCRNSLYMYPPAVVELMCRLKFVR